LECRCGTWLLHDWADGYNNITADGGYECLSLFELCACNLFYLTLRMWGRLETASKAVSIRSPQLCPTSYWPLSHGASTLGYLYVVVVVVAAAIVVAAAAVVVVVFTYLIY